LKGLDGFRCGVQSIAKDIKLRRSIYLGKERVNIPKWYYYMMALPPQGKLKFQTNNS
jgi:hypothetical protein